jgi:hypothetical protein
MTPDHADPKNCDRQTDMDGPIMRSSFTLEREEHIIIAVYSQYYIKPINTLCGQSIELLIYEEVVHIVIAGL